MTRASLNSFKMDAISFESECFLFSEPIKMSDVQLADFETRSADGLRFAFKVV